MAYWSPVVKAAVTNECTRFLHIFYTISNEQAPLKTKENQSKPNKPWITKIKRCYYGF